MTFTSSLTRSPLPYDIDRAREVEEQFRDLPDALRELIANSASASPYFYDLITREADWLRGALVKEPDAVIAELLAAVRDLALGDLVAGLRAAKRRVAIYAGLADLGGVWSLMEVTGALTQLADAAVHACLTRLVADEIRRGKLPGATPEDADRAGGMVALAMGKMGAGELNYSSDIDLICLYDETQFAPDDRNEARAAFIRVTRKMAQIMNDTSSGGYVFRTDLRLRPDASVTPVCISMASAELYYEAEGRTWERAAYIKARPCAGDLAAGERFLMTLKPFVWRKHLDFAAI